MSMGIRRREFTPQGVEQVEPSSIPYSSITEPTPQASLELSPEPDTNRRTVFDEEDKPIRYSYRYIGNQRVAIPR